MAQLTGKAVVAQSGGPTAVINQSLVGVVLESAKHARITGVYGAMNGVSGIVREDFVDLGQETSYNLERVAVTPSSALGSTRDKPDEKYCEEILQVFRLHDVRYFFYIGGNDSSDTARIVNEQARKSGYDLRAVHIPKTIDNDLMQNDHTPGYPSAAKFVAQAFAGINLDNAALPGVHVGVVMGRHAGFLTASSSLARVYPEDGPHLIYLPETPFVAEDFLMDVREVYSRLGRCVIAVSEGIQDRDGVPILSTLMDMGRDDHGNVQLSGTGALGELLTQQIKDRLGIKRVRSDTFGYLQRSFLGCVSEVDQHEAREVAEKAVQIAVAHDADGSVTIQRVGDYAVDYTLSPLHEVAARTRLMPMEFISRSGNNVTDAFRRYLEPLLGSGMPQAGALRSPRVKKLRG